MPAPRSLLTLRQRLARRLGGFQALTTDGAGSTTSFTASGLAGIQDTNALKGAWILPLAGSNAGIVRRVRADSALNVNSGLTQVFPAWSASLDTGTAIEVHTILPPVDHALRTGLLTCLNNALEECWFPARLTIAGNPNASRYDLSSYEAYLDAADIQEVYGGAQLASAALQPWPGFDVWADSATLTLEASDVDSYGLIASTTRRAHSYIKAAGVTWGTSTVGLALDTDECLTRPTVVVETALFHAYQYLALNGDDAVRGEYRQRALVQRVKANHWKLDALWHPSTRLGQGGGGAANDNRDPKVWW